jgi:hypothetical protein
MILQHGKDPVSARWIQEEERWDIGERIKYRWVDNKNQPKSDWHYDLTDALQWIIKYDEGQNG